MIYGASERNSNHSIATIGGERLQKIRYICQNFQNLARIQGLVQYRSLQQIQQLFGDCTEYINEKSFHRDISLKTLKIKPEYRGQLPHILIALQSQIYYSQYQPDQKQIVNINLRKMEQMLKQNFQSIYKQALVDKLSNILNHKLESATLNEFIDSNLIAPIRAIFQEVGYNQDENKEQEKNQQKEEEKEEKKVGIIIGSKLSYKALMKIKTHNKIDTDQQYDILKEGFEQVAQTLSNYRYLTKVEFYNENKTIIELLGLLVDLDVESIAEEEMEIKVKIARGVKDVIKVFNKGEPLVKNSNPQSLNQKTHRFSKSRRQIDKTLRTRKVSSRSPVKSRTQTLSKSPKKFKKIK